MTRLQSDELQRQHIRRGNTRRHGCEFKRRNQAMCNSAVGKLFSGIGPRWNGSSRGRACTALKGSQVIDKQAVKPCTSCAPPSVNEDSQCCTMFASSGQAPSTRTLGNVRPVYPPSDRLCNSVEQIKDANKCGLRCNSCAARRSSLWQCRAARDTVRLQKHVSCWPMCTGGPREELLLSGSTELSMLGHC
jgi:hypothetical protein